MSWLWPERRLEEYTPRLIDLQFDLEGTTIPSDNARLLAAAIHTHLPWLDEDGGTGIQHLKGTKTNADDDALHINRRTKLYMRVPQHRARDAMVLVGKEIDLDGHVLRLGSFKTRPFSPFPNLYAHLVDTNHDSEEDFVRDIMEILDGHFQLRCGFICGRPQTLTGSDGRAIHGYSLMLHDVPTHKSLQIQDEGMGRNRLLGCGLFIPHKSIAPVVPETF